MKWFVAVLVLVGVIVMVGCTSSWKVVDIHGLTVSYRTGGVETTFVLDSPPGSMMEFVVWKVTFIADRFGYVKTV